MVKIKKKKSFLESRALKREEVVSEELHGYKFKNVDKFKRKLNARKKKKYQQELENVIKCIERGEYTYKGKRGKDIFYTFYQIGKDKMVVFN